MIGSPAIVKSFIFRFWISLERDLKMFVKSSSDRRFRKLRRRNSRRRKSYRPFAEQLEDRPLLAAEAFSYVTGP